MNKIFLVEDDPVISKAVVNHLTMWGYEIKAAVDFGRVLEKAAEEGAPEGTLVVTDCQNTGRGRRVVQHVAHGGTADVVHLS